MSTFAERKKIATPAEITINLCLDLQLHDVFWQAYQELQQLQLDGSDRPLGDEEQTTLDDGTSPRERVREVVQRMAEAADAINAASEPYVFRKLRRHEWRDLVEAHPATDEQVAEWKEQIAELREQLGSIPKDVEKPTIDAESFWPVAIAKCSHDPKLTEADAEWLRDGDGKWSGLPEGEFDRLCTDLAHLHDRGAVPKDLFDTAQILRRGLSGITPANAASPSRSSAGGSRTKAKPTG